MTFQSSNPIQEGRKDISAKEAAYQDCPTERQDADILLIYNSERAVSAFSDRSDQQGVVTRTLKESLPSIADIDYSVTPLSTSIERRLLTVIVQMRDALQELRKTDGNDIKFSAAEQVLYDEARKKLAAHNVKLCVHIGKRYNIPGYSFEDKLGVGILALYRAMDSFSLDNNTRFATYATWWVRQHLGEVSKKENQVQYSRDAICQTAAEIEIRKLRESLAHQYGRPATIEEVYDNLKSKPQKEQDFLKIYDRTLNRTSVSLESPIGNPNSIDSDFNVRNITSNRRTEENSESIEKESIRRIFDSSGLNNREKTTIALRFDFTGEGGMTLREIGKVLEVSKERIRQYEAKALDKMRKNFVKQGLVDRELLLDTARGSGRKARAHHFDQKVNLTAKKEVLHVVAGDNGSALGLREKTTGNPLKNAGHLPQSGSEMLRVAARTNAPSSNKVLAELRGQAGAGQNAHVAFRKDHRGSSPIRNETLNIVPPEERKKGAKYEAPYAQNYLIYAEQADLGLSASELFTKYRGAGLKLENIESFIESGFFSPNKEIGKFRKKSLAESETNTELNTFDKLYADGTLGRVVFEGITQFRQLPTKRGWWARMKDEELKEVVLGWLVDMLGHPNFSIFACKPETAYWLLREESDRRR